ncbi:MAG: thioredoxin domain-containing protein [Sulfurovum sp.]|nr:thioredoxin domain-containing protein [Sulfurovum sp.]
MSLMSKLLTSSIIATLALSAEAFDIEKYVKNHVVKNKQVKVKSVDTLSTKKIPGSNDWNAYLVMVNLNYNGKDIKEPMTIFVDVKSGLATMGLINVKTGRDYQRTIKPNIPKDYYKEKNLIAGNKDAKYKVAIFSDPQCPFCIDFVPKVFKEFKETKADIALYYYHMPLLRLHPVAEPLTRIMEVLQKEGKMDQAMNVYNLKISAKETNEDIILKALKDQLKIEVSKEAISKQEIKDAVKQDMEAATKLMIRGTPTVYFDSEFDETRVKYKQYLK